MMRCPVCDFTFVDGVTSCPKCNGQLVPYNEPVQNTETGNFISNNQPSVHPDYVTKTQTYNTGQLSSTQAPLIGYNQGTIINTMVNNQLPYKKIATIIIIIAAIFAAISPFVSYIKATILGTQYGYTLKEVIDAYGPDEYFFIYIIPVAFVFDVFLRYRWSLIITGVFTIMADMALYNTVVEDSEYIANVFNRGAGYYLLFIGGLMAIASGVCLFISKWKNEE